MEDYPLSLSLYNTRTRSKDVFEPLNPNRIGLYVCGPTVYDYAHVGNARPVVVFDVLYRLLQHLYPQVTYVRNITDVDDKIITASRRALKTIDELTSETTIAFHQDMAALKALPPTHEPRATAHIPEMQEMIASLLRLGHAYEAQGHVLFNVPSMPDYGALSGRDRSEMIAGARVEVAPYKRDPADFVLWKPSIDGAPGWNSPWGYGRPGWHIECSAMSKAFLGETFDIHGGGLDLIFPHHENEIAQSRCAHAGAHLARYWVHNGFVMVNGQKMAKSLGNFFTVRQLLQEGWPGEVIRLALLSAHYRQPLDFTRDTLAQARGTLDRWYTALASTSETAPPQTNVYNEMEILDVLQDDLNVPAAIARLHDMTTAINRCSDDADRRISSERLRRNANLLGFLTDSPKSWLQRANKPTTKSHEFDRDQIEELIRQRSDARQSKNFTESDRIRSLLAADGVILEDHRDGRPTTWRRS